MESHNKLHYFDLKVKYCVGLFSIETTSNFIDAMNKKRPYLWMHVVFNFQGVSTP